MQICNKSVVSQLSKLLIGSILLSLSPATETSKSFYNNLNQKVCQTDLTLLSSTETSNSIMSLKCSTGHNMQATPKAGSSTN